MRSLRSRWEAIKMRLDASAIPKLFGTAQMNLWLTGVSVNAGHRLKYIPETECIEWGGKPENAFKAKQLRNGEIVFEPAYKVVRKAMGGPKRKYPERRTCSTPTCTAPWHRDIFIPTGGQ